MNDRKTVLVADDEAGIRDLASRALSAAGFEVVTAADGRAALKVMETVHVDLAVIDIIMPEKEGVETIIEFRERWPDCKIIAISGGGRAAPELFLTLADAFGVDATMKKSLSFSLLVQTVGELLGTRAAGVSA